MKRLIVAVAALAFGSVCAFADEKPTDAEAAQISAAVTAHGCSGGKYEKDVEGDRVYEVDDAVCKDGKYDLDLDKDFKIIRSDKDDD
jgi:hypothetical protein